MSLGAEIQSHIHIIYLRWHNYIVSTFCVHAVIQYYVISPSLTDTKNHLF